MREAHGQQAHRDVVLCGRRRAASELTATLARAVHSAGRLWAPQKHARLWRHRGIVRGTARCNILFFVCGEANGVCAKDNSSPGPAPRASAWFDAVRAAQNVP